MKNFGGDWTAQKIEIVVEYAKAYLGIMKTRKFWKLLYFDGFAGSGFIVKDDKYDKEDIDVIEGAARRILAVNDPGSFDLYYFVEKDKKNAKLLSDDIKRSFPEKDKKAFVVTEDCNKKLKDLAAFLESPKGKNYKVLAFVDPFGMQVEWNSLQALKGLGVDLWILIPLGMGVNRLLTKDGKIEPTWSLRLQSFLGMMEHEIFEAFYEEHPIMDLFGENTAQIKKDNAIEIAGKLYREKLQQIFKFVSKPFLMANAKNSLMYHFILGSNNQTAVKIANDVVRKWSES
jgi:three-Cys-motif partner protein